MVRYLAAAGCFVSATILGSTWAWGQSSNATPPKDGQSTQGKDLPRLPETEVVGQPPARREKGTAAAKVSARAKATGTAAAMLRAKAARSCKAESLAARRRKAIMPSRRRPAR